VPYTVESQFDVSRIEGGCPLVTGHHQSEGVERCFGADFKILVLQNITSSGHDATTRHKYRIMTAYSVYEI